MSKFKSPEIDRYDDRTGSHIAQIRNGATLNILNGAGGYEIYKEDGEQRYYEHWQKKYALGDSKENEKRFGGLFCTFNVGGNNKKAKCEFLRINSSDKLFDSFTIYQNDNPSSVHYSDIDDNFKNEKLKAYLANKGIADVSPEPLNTFDANSFNTHTNTNTNTDNSPDNNNKPADPAVDDITVSTTNTYEDENGNYEENTYETSRSYNEVDPDDSGSKSTERGIIIGASTFVIVTLAASGLIALKIKKNKHLKDDPESGIISSPTDQSNYRKHISSKDKKKKKGEEEEEEEDNYLKYEDFVPIPMPSYFYDSKNDQFTSSNSKYNKYL